MSFPRRSASSAAASEAIRPPPCLTRFETHAGTHPADRRRDIVPVPFKGEGEARLDSLFDRLAREARLDGLQKVLRGLAHVVEVVLKAKLRRVHADHHQTLIPVFLGPRADVGKGAEPVDTGVGPEVDENDFSAQAGRRQWL